MRITSIISSFANAIARFDNAGAEMVRALLPVEPRIQTVQQTRLHPCAGSPGYLSSGNSGATNWLWNLTAKPEGIPLAFGIGINPMQVPTVDSRDLASGTTRSLVGLGLS